MAADLAQPAGAVESGIDEPGPTVGVDQIHVVAGEQQVDQQLRGFPVVQAGRSLGEVDAALVATLPDVAQVHVLATAVGDVGREMATAGEADVADGQAGSERIQDEPDAGQFVKRDESVNRRVRVPIPGVTARGCAAPPPEGRREAPDFASRLIRLLDPAAPLYFMFCKA